MGGIENTYSASIPNSIKLVELIKCFFLKRFHLLWIFSFVMAFCYSFLKYLLCFVSPDLEILAQPHSVAFPSVQHATAKNSLFLSSSVNESAASFPLSPVYARLLHHHKIECKVMDGRVLWIPSLAFTSRLWPHAWAAATLFSGLLPHLCLYSAVSGL